jgi:hypothetical protein
MAVCVVIENQVLLQSPVSSDGVCAGFWLVTPDDKVTFLERIFDPAFLTQPEYETLFTLGLTLPVICYLTAWGFASVINFLNSHSRDYP